MKNILTVILVFIALSGYSQATEVFTVVKVKGNIYNVSAKVAVKAGSTVGAKDQLDFGSADAEAIAISNTRGKFIIKQPADDVFGDAVAMVSANSSASPIASRSQYSVRAIDFKVEDLGAYLGDDTFFIIGDTVNISLSAATYPLNDKKYLLVSFPYNGSETNIELINKGQDIHFVRQKIFQPYSSLKEIEAVSFYYLDADAESIKRVATVNVSFISEKELFAEVSLVENILKSQGMDRKQMLTYMKQYLNDIYGNTDPAAEQVFLAKVLAD